MGEDDRRVERDTDGVAPGGGTGANTAVTFALTANWQQIWIPVSLGQATTSVTFGAELAAGATVDLFGMQVEAQLAASDYKMTGINGGVYANARFAADTLDGGGAEHGRVRRDGEDSRARESKRPTACTRRNTNRTNEWRRLTR